MIELKHIQVIKSAYNKAGKLIEKGSKDEVDHYKFVAGFRVMEQVKVPAALAAQFRDGEDALFKQVENDLKAMVMANFYDDIILWMAQVRTCLQNHSVPNKRIQDLIVPMMMKLRPI